MHSSIPYSKCYLPEENRDHMAGFLGLIIVGIVNIWCTKRSGPYQYSIDINRKRHLFNTIYWKASASTSQKVQ